MIKNGSKNTGAELDIEYSNISSAHYKALDRASQFFRYYLIVISAPFLLSSTFLASTKNSKIYDEYSIHLVLGILFLSVAAVGVFMFLHTLNLRFDATLYARTINGLRGHKYESLNLAGREGLIRSLPKSINIPAYSQKSVYYPIIGPYLIINSLYLCGGVYNITVIGWQLFVSEMGFPGVIPISNLYIFLVSIFILGALLHIGLYKFFVFHRQNIYLERFNIGINANCFPLNNDGSIRGNVLDDTSILFLREIIEKRRVEVCIVGNDIVDVQNKIETWAKANKLWKIISLEKIGDHLPTFFNWSIGRYNIGSFLRHKHLKYFIQANTNSAYNFTTDVDNFILIDSDNLSASPNTGKTIPSVKRVKDLSQAFKLIRDDIMFV